MGKVWDGLEDGDCIYCICIMFGGDRILAYVCVSEIGML